LPTRLEVLIAEPLYAQAMMNRQTETERDATSVPLSVVSGKKSNETHNGLARSKILPWTLRELVRLPV
jgi:hypothetical protein